MTATPCGWTWAGAPAACTGYPPKGTGRPSPYSPDLGVVIERHGDMMPEPERGGEGWLDAFCSLLRVQESQRPLFCAHLCHMFCMHHQTPAMLLSGPAGSGKTSAARLVRELVDPVGIEHAVSVLPKSADSLRKILSGSPVASFDCVRRINKETADALSGALEGLAMIPDRQKHPVSFGNARLILAAPEGKPKRLHSLAGKVIRYELPPVEEWKTPGKLAAEFHSMGPRLYHEIFDVLHRAFGDPGEVLPSTRMADFEITGRAISRHAGYGEEKFDGALEPAAGRDAQA